MSILKRIEKQLEDKLKSAFTPADAPANDREMIEIHRAVLDDIAGRVQPGGRGRRVFPFNHVVVRVSTRTTERRAMYDAMFGNGAQFLEDVRGSLAEAGVDAPADLEVEMQPEDADLPGGYHVSFGKRDTTAQVARPPAEPLIPGTAKLSVVQGTAEKPEYAISAARVNIGRLAEVVDDQQRLIRRNNIVFAETAEGPNATVSRGHAHIAWDSSTGTYRLFDDGSAYGTSIFRDGALLQVPTGGGRGVALRTGDEIYVGQARLRFES